jgi:predicted transposase YbfD/YdcC
VVQTLTIRDLGVDFPHAVQVAKSVRHRTQRKTGRGSRETVYVITNLTSREASPQRIAEIVRSQWVIENRLHFVRDTTFAEDASKVRTGHGPDNMATLRNFAINTLRAVGHANISARRPWWAVSSACGDRAKAPRDRLTPGKSFGLGGRKQLPCH